MTPFITTETRTLELRYRQAFRNGRIEIRGRDFRRRHDTGKRHARLLFGEGRFDLPRDFTLTFDIEAVSDDTYLLDYGYSEKDRLDSEIALERT